MGSIESETVDQVPSAKKLAEHIQTNWTAHGIYPRGQGDGYLSIVLPNRFHQIADFIDEIKALAGQDSRIAYVAVPEETRLDVYLGSRFGDGQKLPTRGPSMCRTVAIGAMSGIISCIGMMAMVRSGLDTAV